MEFSSQCSSAKQRGRESKGAEGGAAEKGAGAVASSSCLVSEAWSKRVRGEGIKVVDGRKRKRKGGERWSDQSIISKTSFRVAVTV